MAGAGTSPVSTAVTAPATVASAGIVCFVSVVYAPWIICHWRQNTCAVVRHVLIICVYILYTTAIEIRRSPQADAPKRSVSGDMGSSQASSLSARSYRQNSGMRKVSFDGAVPGAAEGAVADSAAGSVNILNIR